MKKHEKKDRVYQAISTNREIKNKLRRIIPPTDKKIEEIKIKSRALKLDKFNTIFMYPWAHKSKDVKIKLPAVFSLQHNPAETLKTICKISSLKEVPKLKSIEIDHSSCTKHDLPAEILLAHTVVALKSFRTNKGGKLRIKGILPSSPKMARLIRSIGVVKETSNPRYHIKDDDKLRIFRRNSDVNETTTIHSLDKKTRATQDFLTHINNCLSHIGAKLDADESKKLKRYLGEVLGNAEEHSGTQIWDIVSYLDAEQTKKELEIVIYSVGKTIYQTFDEKKNVPIVYDGVDKYVNRHNKAINEEPLIMVYALQQNISSKKTEEDKTRGQGTKYLIDLFHHFSMECKRINQISSGNVSHSRPEMCIISGSGVLRFDGRYDPLINSRNKMVYAFNKDNDLEKAPDKKYVKNMKHIEFPGAIIYIKLPLEDVALSEVGDEY